MNDVFVEDSFGFVFQVAVVFFIVFFVFVVFFWIKTLFEINKFKKLEKIYEDLKVFNSNFFLNKLVEIRNLSLKNKSYSLIFLTFYQKYQYLFNKEFLPLFEELLESLNSEENLSTFFVENQLKINVLQDFAKINKKIENLAKDLRLFSVWENFFLDKVNDIHHVLDKVWEKIERNKIVLPTNKEEVIRIFKSLQKEVDYFEHSIYQNSYNETFYFFQKLEEKISDFIPKVFLWIKLQTLLFFYLPKKEENLQSLVQELNLLDEKKALANFKQRIQLTQGKSQALLKKFAVYEIEKIILDLIVTFDQNISQLKKYQFLRKTFQDSFKVVTVAFEKIKKNFENFKGFIKSVQKNNYVHNLKLVKKLDFDYLINQTQKEINWLFIKNYQIDNIYFFQELLLRIKVVLENLQKLIIIYHQVNLLVAKEKEEKEHFFLMLNNLNALINKKENFFLKKLYKVKLQKCIEIFIDFEKLILLTHKKYFENDLSFSDLKNRILTLKMEVQNSILLKNIAENLFVFTNKYRFYNDYLYNQILNCEVLFLRQNYKGVIDILLEMHNQLKSSNN